MRTPEPHPVLAAFPRIAALRRTTGTESCKVIKARFESSASVWSDHDDFRSTPVNGRSQDRRACLKGARSEHDDGGRWMFDTTAQPALFWSRSTWLSLPLLTAHCLRKGPIRHLPEVIARTVGRIFPTWKTNHAFASLSLRWAFFLWPWSHLHCFADQTDGFRPLAGTERLPCVPLQCSTVRTGRACSRGKTL